MQTRNQGANMTRAQILITASKHNFLRVNAQMYNLDKQKTTPACNPLGAICRATNFRKNKLFDRQVSANLTFRRFGICFDLQ
jgi:hypothetical protein